MQAFINTKVKPVAKAIIYKMLGHGNGEFSKRIKHRNAAFWNNPEGKRLKNTHINATDPLAKWQEGTYWQRRLSNKHNSLEFAKMMGCRIPGMYWQGNDLNAFKKMQLPEHYVIRPSIGAASKLVFLMNGSLNLMNKRTYTKESLVAELQQALEKDPRLEFLVGEFVKTEQGVCRIPDDYKFYMFNGEIACIQVINRLSPSKGYTTFYDENWKQMKNLSTHYPKGAYQEPPACLKEMIADARKLSRVYEIFARIDFYATDKGAVFGEFTPTPAMGKDFTRAGDKYLTTYWDKYCKGKI